MHNPADLNQSGLGMPVAVPAHVDDGRTLYVEGLIALRNGDADGAADLLVAALRRQPTNLDMRRNLVRALMAGRRFRNAVVQADACLSQRPDDPELHYARGSALTALGEPVKACAALTRAVALQPDHAASNLNLGNAWADLDDLAEAERLCRTAIALDPGLAEAHASLGYILTARGALPDAIEACEAGIRLRPGFTQAHWNLAIAALLAGDLKRGFAEFEWRKWHQPFRQDFPPLPGPVWDGAEARGRTILVRSEQGLGDTIQFARLLPAIHRAGGHPVLQCPMSLHPLLAQLPGVTVIAPGDSHRNRHADRPPRYDAWMDLLSLPHVLGTTLDTIPGAQGYLQADPGLVASWRDRLPPGKKVGVAFAGNPRHANDRRRSIPAVRLPAIPGITFINLQQGPAAAALGLQDRTDDLTDFGQTAALTECLDLVITVDTAVAHLAGALGKPTWVLLPAAPDWRWMLDRCDSPWYASVRLFRQDTPGDWASVLGSVFRCLGAS